MMFRLVILPATGALAIQVVDSDKSATGKQQKKFDPTKCRPIKMMRKMAPVIGAAAVKGANAMGDMPCENPCNPYCDGTKQQIWTDLADIPCFDPNDANMYVDGEPWGIQDGTAFDLNAVQSGADVTLGATGHLDAALDPVEMEYTTTCTDLGCMCPVNVHWHLGAEHYNTGTYDVNGEEWIAQYGRDSGDGDHRRTAGYIEPGNWCPEYDENDPAWTTEYDWQYCTDMHVGYTYEIHWPHSNLGKCGTEWQFQTHFMDGVLCIANELGLPTDVALDTVFGTSDDGVSGNLAGDTRIGVQAQVVQIVNDPAYDYPEWDALRSWNKECDECVTDVAIYQGSTTGLNNGNVICRGTGGAVTWQVDRGCHKMSAWKMDDLCRQMLEQKDDMSGDIYPHTARDTVLPELTDSSPMESYDFSDYQYRRTGRKLSAAQPNVTKSE